MKIHSKVKDYSMEMIEGLFNLKKEIFSSLKYNRLFYLIDENVFLLYKKELMNFIGEDTYFVIPASEENKSYIKIADYYRLLIDKSFMRSDVLVTFGGGILQDISGFIASTLYRGVRWVLFPTTLLAQADSCIGSKTSINFGDSKNLIGSFYPPDIIRIDSAFCSTLDDEYFNSGIGEIIKFHLMSDSKGYALLKSYLSLPNLRSPRELKEIILSTLMIKKSYFETDELDQGRRNLLNYGHCFGHALESASNFLVCHGEAVIVGMGFANLLSLKRKIMTKDRYDELEAIFKQYYPKFDLSKVSVESLIGYLKRDKKRVGKDLTMILCQDIGKQIKFNDIKESEIRDIFKEFLKSYF